MNCKLVIFDLDGTLIDTIGDLGAAANVALSGRGYPLHDPEAYRGMVGHGVRNLMKKAMPEALREDEALLDALLADFLAYYIEHIDDRSRPYPGIPQLLSDLTATGVKVAVASNKFQAGTEKLIRRFFPEIPFAAVRGGQDGVPLKPDPAVLRAIMAEAGAGAGETVMVGDSGTDIATAAAAGIPSVAVTWGFRPEEALRAADHIARSISELRGILMNGDCAGRAK